MDIRIKIKNQLKQDGRSIKWLASQFDVTQTHLSLVLCLKRELSKKNLAIAKEIWPNTDFSYTLPHEQLELDRQSLKDKPL